MAVFWGTMAFRRGPSRRRHLALAPLAAVALWAGGASADPAPWQRTETRADCTSFETLRQPLFGETHVHTEISFDAVSGGINLGPRDAYNFAQGQSVDLPGFSGVRPVQLRRPLDFTAVTDHSEFFGEVDACLTPGSFAYNENQCVQFRAAIPQTAQSSSPGVVLFGSLLTTDPGLRFPFCGSGGTLCTTAASPIWNDTLSAADEFYDRSATCSFTTFPAYEWTGNPTVQNIHRNVIFRNEFVPALPISYLDESKPQGLWAELRTQCIDAGTGCDALAIPHNSNLSNGIMFVPENADGSPVTAADAAFRSAMEPLVEVMQHKGDSECHPDLSPNDELCGFEKWSSDRIGLPPGFGGPLVQEPSSFVRNALMEGIAQEEAIGANPFRMGMLAATDSHNATPGLTHENDFIEAGHLGLRDASVENQLVGLGIGVVGGIEANGGGLAVVWAEENSRDAIFAAMRRREVYATSGTRPIVRFFGGRIPRNVCRQGTVVERGYESGVPMGGEIGPVARKPRFAVMATRDPGAAGFTAAPLQRIQIVKGWVDVTGTARERVFEVAGDPDNGATVDTATCAAGGTGFDSLCEVWIDPQFDADQRAFYYARVVENPVCRWSQVLCNQAGVDCLGGTIPPGTAECCNSSRPTTIQERAWTSPIWYRPEGIARLRGRVSFGSTAGPDDVLRMTLRLAEAPADLDPDTNDIRIDVTDNDVIFSANIPAGTMQPSGNGFIYKDPTGAIGGLKKVKLTFTSRGGARLVLQTIPMDLSNADQTDHMVHVTLTSGDYTATHNRMWDAVGNRFVTSRR